MTEANPIHDVVKRGLCTGCGLCRSLAAPGKVSVSLSPEGFLRPIAASPLSAPEIEAFDAACPGRRIEHDVSDTSIPRHVLWGPLLTTQTGYATNPQLRQQGSSGGVVSALCAFLLDSGRVDFIAQTSADPADPLGNALQKSTEGNHVLMAAGSRYGPSAPLSKLEELLAAGQRFAFVGKPCDVAALRARARTDPRIDRQVPYMLSFMCAGVPSRAGTLALLKKMGTRQEDVVKFRYRGDGWPGMARAETADGRVLEMDYATSWGQVLNRHLQFRCKICPDGTGEFADVVCADAWYGKDGYPDFAEQEGRSLVLGRSRKGVALIAEAVRAGAIQVTDLEVGEIEKMQPYQVARKRLVGARLVGAAAALGTMPRVRHLGLLRAAAGAKPLELLRSAVGTYRRARKEAA